jgi:hypothetical protein
MTSIQIIRGRDFSIGLQFSQPTGEPLDLTGCRVLVTFKSRADDDPLDANAFFKTDISTHEDARGGLSRLDIPWAQTKSFPVGGMYYDVELINDASKRIQFSAPCERGEVIRPITNRM